MYREGAMVDIIKHALLGAGSALGLAVLWGLAGKAAFAILLVP